MCASLQRAHVARLLCVRTTLEDTTSSQVALAKRPNSANLAEPARGRMIDARPMSAYELMRSATLTRLATGFEHAVVGGGGGSSSSIEPALEAHTHFGALGLRSFGAVD